MRIIFTQHALSQMKIRNISIDNVIDCIKNPEMDEIDVNGGNRISQKLYSPYLLRVVYRVEVDDKVIITAYRTSKLKKDQEK